MTLASNAHEAAYRIGCGAIGLLLRVPFLADALTRFSKIWLRHARIARHLRTAGYDQVIDGGANIGEFAALVRQSCPEVPLLCVEPHPRAAATLRRRGFDVVEAALWNAAGNATLTQPTAASTSSTLLSAAGGDLPRFTVRTVRLDELPVRGRRVFLKLDLQGAEREALDGLGEAWGRLHAVLLEVSYGAAGTYEPLRALLASRGFHEAATWNELDAGGSALEADKLWIRAEPARSRVDGAAAAGPSGRGPT